MQNVKFKIWKVLLVLVVVVLIVAFLALRSKPDGQDQKGSVPDGQDQKGSVLKGASFKNLIPEQNSKTDAIDTLGQPLNDRESSSLDFKSNNPNLPHQVVTEDEKITFIKEVITAQDGKSSIDIIDLYGVAPHILYGLESIHGFNLNVYPDKGIAYIGHLREPILLEVWYFQPTTFEDFKDKWAPNYSGTPQVRQ